MTQTTAYPITIYYDASCQICDSEMQNIKLHDAHNRLVLIDCSPPEFDDTGFAAFGITRQAMMHRLHARDAEGRWLIGVAAFEEIYQSVGLAVMSKLWGSRWTRPLNEILYPWVADNRYLLSKLGLPKLFRLWGKHAARQAEKRSRSCSEGRCTPEQ
ncbi:MAG: thiol-disulfide oxidoreductase DCC [Methylobacter sp.]|nr:MAG: thiol-disulfide oxidoreductase DCC [Methylobacter sp.]